MGTNGNTIVCENGHIMVIFESGLQWDETMEASLDDAREEKCGICGEPAIYDICSYDVIDDCQKDQIHFIGTRQIDVNSIDKKFKIRRN